MPAVGERSERETLRLRAERIEELVVPPPREEDAWDWFARLEDAVLELSTALPAGPEDYEGRKLFEYLTELRRAIADDRGRTDPDARVALAAARIGDVARRLERRLSHLVLEIPEVAARFVLTELEDVGATEIAALLGVSTRTISAWRQGKPVRTNADRVVLVAQVVSYLRASMTPRGVTMWFAAKHDALGGRTPLELLDAQGPLARPALVAKARGGRAQLAD